MKIFLTVAFLAVTAFAIDPIIKEGCGCCWPLPESCCPETTTTATTTEATQPPTTTPTPAPPITSLCACESDAVILVDRTGSVEDLEVQTVETFVLDLVTTMGVPGGVACHKWAFSAFANRAPMDVNFGDAASSNIAAFALAITPIDPPSGNSNLGSAFLGARAQFVNGPVTAGAEHVVVFITDGGSDDKANTILRAEKLANDTDARVCIVRMKDPRENGTQLMQRDQEFIDMVAASNPGSAVTGMWDFTGGIPPNAAFIDDVINCICPGTPPTVTTTPPPPPTTTTDPCPIRRDIVFVLDTTGSIVLTELNNVKTVINTYVATLNLSCYRTAVVSFNKTGTQHYTFSDPASTNAAMSAAIVNGIPGPNGDTGTQKAFVNTNAVFQARTNTNPCPVIIMFYDGGSDQKATVLAQAQSVVTAVDPRMCMMDMLEVGNANTVARENEIDDIVALFGKFSPARYPDDYLAPNIPADVAQMMACVDAVC